MRCSKHPFLLMAVIAVLCCIWPSSYGTISLSCAEPEVTHATSYLPFIIASGCHRFIHHKKSWQLNSHYLNTPIPLFGSSRTAETGTNFSSGDSDTFS
ncbi:hypothetical protein EJ08DRAFT_650971 [Tothia fuscella]|uniref:Uncharacterized protein n=1 Tax=Tothia fuscella TaxID=1048955 RepID=A0A9P4TWR1_9PEZI|nr:hypothetical protein EJ08DRAFT_650971 [Tothia fuscella]